MSPTLSIACYYKLFSFPTAYPSDFTRSEFSITLTSLNGPQCANITALIDSDVECQQYFTVFHDSAGPGTVEVTAQQINITPQQINIIPPEINITIIDTTGM